MNKTDELKKLEKRATLIRLSSILFLGLLLAGGALEIPTVILAIVIIGGAAALVGFVGIPTQKRLFELRKEIAEEG
ncbi:MAG: hypothetical protein J5717_04720 [Lachnospiraceae bacterium]|nr:hypothetical protein [Lachnospiraceae bacterium]